MLRKTAKFLLLAMMITTGVSLGVRLLAAEDVKVFENKNKAEVIIKKQEMKGLELEVALTPRYVAGCGMDCLVSVTNRSNKPVNYGHIITPFELQVKVVDAEGKPLPLTRWGATVIHDSDRYKYVIKELAPGEAIALKVNLSRYYDLTMPGKYEATFGWNSESTSSDKGVQLQLAKLEFEVQEPQ